ncbi:MAG: sulfite exporter TauE/SafE family protein [SAR202 cluster bacterium]|jgi:hypothetical protein|nr:sulfite exporter TauE/SafE family protein [SAR202 cluster bacterium]MDP6513932.1 sulfite exporter TauE/SafE family protein [SAR202 cluster bacterium]MDP6713547.1 sulfite exporter TauE/SafE family protein [SAR202 cluster bacterium]
MDLIWLVLLGIGTGAYGVLVGAGGGFILGPMLLLFFDMEPEVVAGTVLASVAINSISGTSAYRAMKIIDYRSGLLFAAAAVPGSVLGALGVGAVAPSTFRILFGVVLLLLSAQLAFRPNIPESNRTETPTHRISATVRSRRIVSEDGGEYRYEFNEMLATSFNVILGFISSFFGTGGGFIRTPILVSAFGFPVHVAAATSVFALAIYTTAGALTHTALGHVEWWPTFALTGAGLVLGGQIGARIAGRTTGPWILRLLLVVVLFLGVRLIWQGALG